MPVNPSGKTWELTDQGNGKGNTNSPVGGGPGDPGDPSGLPLINGWDTNVFTYQGGFRMESQLEVDLQNPEQVVIGKHNDPNKMWASVSVQNYLGTNEGIADFTVFEATIPNLTIDDDARNFELSNITSARFSVPSSSDQGPSELDPAGAPKPSRNRCVYEYNNSIITIPNTYYPGTQTPGQVDAFYVIDDASDITNSTITGIKYCQYDQNANGWITEVPSEWVTALGTSYLLCSCNLYANKNRYSIGPSVFSVDPQEIIDTPALGTVSVSPFMNFPGTSNSIHLNKYPTFNLFNADDDTGDGPSQGNDMWTHETKGNAGFIIPGTRTYLFIGTSAGMGNAPVTGLDSFCRYKGYKYGKPPQNLDGSDGKNVNGYHSTLAYDYHPFYMMFDVNDFVDVKNGVKQPSELLPYSYGRIPETYFPNLIPVGETRDSLLPLIGDGFSGYIDPDNNRMMLCCRRGYYPNLSPSPTVLSIGYNIT